MANDDSITSDDTGLPRDLDVSRMTSDLLDKLSTEQVSYVQNMAMRRRNPEISRRVTAALAGQEPQVIASLGKWPPVYVSPEIELIMGVTVTFRSLLTVQSEDATEATQAFIREKRPSDMLAAQYMSQMFLCHGLQTFNGSPFANRQLGDDIASLMANAPDKAREALASMRATRNNHLAMMPASLVSALIAANEVFQGFYDGIVNLRGTPEEVESKTKRLVAAVGNSIGPRVAGQKPT